MGLGSLPVGGVGCGYVVGWGGVGVSVAGCQAQLFAL